LLSLAIFLRWCKICTTGEVASILLSLAIESVKNETKPQPESRPMGERLSEKVSNKS